MALNDFVQFLDEKNQNNINNIVVNDRLLFANLSYAYQSKKINFYSPLSPGNKNWSSFSINQCLCLLILLMNFILIGNKELHWLSCKNIKK